MRIKSVLALLILFTCNLDLTGCTIISISQGEKVYVGNNEDWYIPYTKYRTIAGTENTYGRIVFSFNDDWGQGGMNEKGLFFDWILNSEESSNWKRDPLKKDLKGNLSEKILAESASVKDALKYYEEYNEPIFDISYIVLVDTSGHTAFVSWEDGKITIEECKGVCAGGYGYYKIEEKLKSIDGQINRDEIKYLLDIAHQEGEYPTLYSNIYDLKSGVIHLYNFHNYEEEVVINLHEALKEKDQSAEIKSLFKTQIPTKEFRILQWRHFLREIETMPSNGWLVVFGALSILLFLVGVAIKVLRENWKLKKAAT